MKLSGAPSREFDTYAHWESNTLLFLGGCAGSVVAGCLFHIERVVAHWDSLETFVRTLVA
jgi:hypothetical protein